MPNGSSLSGRFPWAFALVLVIAALAFREAAIVVLAIGSLGLGLVSTVTGRLALAAIDARVMVDPDRLVAGEETIATLEIANRKWIPLTWVEARLFLDEGVEPAGAGPGIPRGWTDCGFALRGHERVVVRLKLAVPARGAYAIGPLRVRAGDWLGFMQAERSVAAFRSSGMSRACSTARS